MAPSRQDEPEKAAKYAIAASKGFSYYLPKTAQRHLQELFKQLPSAARPIYDEYYRDLMCAKACAAESAIAMTTFVTSSFPRVAKEHNAFAREMNEEIDSDEHEGYEPVKFPIVAEPEPDEEGPTAVASTGKKRKRTPSTRAPTVQKKIRRKRDVIALTSATPPPSSPDPELLLSNQPEPTHTESPVDTANTSLVVDARRLTPEPLGSIEEQKNGTPDSELLHQHSRRSSLLSDAPCSTQASEEDESLESSMTHRKTNEKMYLPQSNTSASSVETTPSLQDLHTNTTNVVPTHTTNPNPPVEHNPRDEPPQSSNSAPTIPISKHLAARATEQPDTTTIILKVLRREDVHADSVSESEYKLQSEEERWLDGMRALEDFDWERAGSRGLEGGGL